MKRFELFEYDKETKRLSEMARASRPDRIVSRYDNRKKSTGDSLSKGPYLQAFVDYLNKNKSLPINGVGYGSTPKTGKQKKSREVITKTFKLSSSEIKKVIKQVELAAQAMDPVANEGGSNESKARTILTNLEFKTSGGIFRIFDVDDSAWKPPSGKKMGGGETPVNQSYQCVISACMAYKILPFPRNASKIAKYVRIGSFGIEEVLRSRDYTAINQQANWSRNAVTTHQVLTKKFGDLKGYIFVEESDPLAKKIDEKAIELWNQFDPTDTITMSSVDRWNPVDIWLMKSESIVSQVLKSNTIEEMNQTLYDLYESGDLIAVSMKKPGSNGKLTVKNSNTSEDEVVEWDTNIQSIITKDKPFGLHGSHQWVSTDGKNTLKVSSYKGTSLTLELVTTGSKAMNGGSASSSTIDTALKGLLKVPSSGPKSGELADIYRNGFGKSSNGKFWQQYAMMHNSIKSNDKMTASELRTKAYVIVDPYTMEPRKQSAGDAVYATYINTVFVHLVMKKQIKNRTAIIEELYKWCSSQTPKSAVHVVVGAETERTDSADNKKRKGKRRPGISSPSDQSAELPVFTNKEIADIERSLPDEDLDTSSGKEPKAMDDPRWKEFEKVKRDRISDLDSKKEKEFNADKKRLSFSAFIDKHAVPITGVGKYNS